jgi:restriction system protein
MATTWQEYQEEVAEFFRSLGLEVTTNHVVQGVRTSHAIDVYVKSHHVGFDVVWVVECKHWSTPVNKLHVLALREIVADLGADRGILLCEVGFQSGALEAATLTNVHPTVLANLVGTASTDLTAMRLRELYDRVETCRVRYWDLPKSVRIEAGLRPDTGAFGYSGNVVIDLANDLIAKTLRGNYPVVVDTMQAYAIFGQAREFTSAAEILSVVTPMVVDLEERLAACGPRLTE